MERLICKKADGEIDLLQEFSSDELKFPLKQSFAQQISFEELLLKVIISLLIYLLQEKSSEYDQDDCLQKFWSPLWQIFSNRMIHTRMMLDTLRQKP